MGAHRHHQSMATRQEGEEGRGGSNGRGDRAGGRQTEPTGRAVLRVEQVRPRAGLGRAPRSRRSRRGGEALVSAQRRRHSVRVGR